MWEKEKLIPRLVNYVSAFKMKFNPFISHLKSKDFGRFLQLIEESECAEYLTNFTEYIKNNILIQDAFE